MSGNKLSKTAGAVAGLVSSDDDLALINRHTLRELTGEEVYTFKVTLCDNRVDRDCERFSTTSLHKLAELYLGKTGVYDHNPSASNQTARIYAAEVVEDTAQDNGEGKPYAAVVARAYMLRDENTAGTIRSIEAGILKEVSVGCAVERITCSICGEDQRSRDCAHVKGKTYDGKRCHHVLEQPCDAFEWSFVAVPAQPGAGVTKALQKSPSSELRAALQALRQAMSQVLDLLPQLEDEKEVQDPEEPEEKQVEPPDTSVQTLISSVKRLLEHTERSIQK